MKQLLWLLVLLPLLVIAPRAHAQAITLANCIQVTPTTGTACDSLATTNPYTGTEGDKAYQFNTKYNTDWLLVENMFGSASVWKSTGSVAAADIVGLFPGCAGTEYLGADGVCHVAGTGTVTSVNVSLSTCVSSGPVTSSGTVSLSACLFGVTQGGTGVNTLTGVAKGNGTSPFTAAASADIIALFSGCTGTEYLGADGACHAASGSGTVTSVNVSLATCTSSGAVTTTGTVALSACLFGVAQGGTGVATITGPLKGNGTSAFSVAAAADIYGLWSGTCNITTFLRGDGSCAAPSGSGTVNSGTAGQLAYYASTGTAVSGTTVAAATLAALQAVTPFTIAGTGCTPTVTSAGPFTGLIALASGTCTSIAITINGATGFTAPHGYICEVADRTAQAAGTYIPHWGEISTTATVVTIPVPAAAGTTDTLPVSCGFY